MKLAVGSPDSMTLAIAILLCGICSGSLTGQTNDTQTQPSIESNGSNPASGTQPTQEQTTPKSSGQDAQPISPQAADQTKAIGPKTVHAKKRSRKKKAVSSGCDVSPAGQTSEVSSSNPSAPVTETTANPTAGSGSQNAGGSKNCPPEKIIVRHGGTAEPSIQLAGGPGGDAAAQKRNAANQMLGSTETNLKKIAGIELSPEQQDTVSQIRQFVDQSKAALAAGDLERGQTLAWKAQVLSADLVKPQK